VTSRDRTCNEDLCDGAAQELGYCYGGECGSWTEWSTWSACTKSCNDPGPDGDNWKGRTRTCEGGNDCPGLDGESEPCDLGVCPTTITPSTTMMTTTPIVSTVPTVPTTPWPECQMNVLGDSGWVRINWQYCAKFMDGKAQKPFGKVQKRCNALVLGNIVPESLDPEFICDVEKYMLGEGTAGAKYRVNAKHKSGNWVRADGSAIDTTDCKLPKAESYKTLSIIPGGATLGFKQFSSSKTLSYICQALG